MASSCCDGAAGVNAPLQCVIEGPIKATVISWSESVCKALPARHVVELVLMHLEQAAQSPGRQTAECASCIVSWGLLRMTRRHLKQL